MPEGNVCGERQREVLGIGTALLEVSDLSGSAGYWRSSLTCA